MTEDRPVPTLPLDYARPDGRRRRGLRWLWWSLGAGAAVLLTESVFLPSLNRPRSYNCSPRVACASNLRQIAMACVMYANENAGRFPDTLNDVLLTQEITPDVFVCPASNDSRATGPTPQALAANLTAGGHLSYVYVGKGLTTAVADSPAGPETILAYELPGHHGGGGMNVVYADSHVEWQDARTVATILAELNAGHNPPRPDRLK